MIRTLLILEHDTKGEFERKVFHEDMTDKEAIALLWEAIKDLTPGIRK
jgi:predicted type IV restriction endonuclease